MGEASTAKTAPRWRTRAPLVVAVVAFLVFLPSVADGFVFDDWVLIPGNEYVHALKWLPRAFATHLWDVGQLAGAGAVDRADETVLHYYRPLVTVSNLLTWVVTRQPWAFHLGNVVLHALTVLLATRAAIRWTRSVVLGLVVGVVFALHPTRGENVIWIAGRMDILMLLFGLASLEAFRRPRGGFALGIAFFVLALLSKEPAVMFPLLFLVESRSKRPLIATAAIAAVYTLARALWLPPSAAAKFLTLKAFLFTIGAYAGRAVAPWPPAMYFDPIQYDAAGVPSFAWQLQAVGVAVLVIGAVVLVLAWRRSRPAFWLFVAAIAFLAPTSNLFFVGMNQEVHDRYLYAPLFFALCGIGRLARPLQRAFRQRSAILALGGVSLVAIGLLELRTLDFRDDQTFWTAELAQNPADPYVLRENGITAAARGDLETALGFYRRAAGGREGVTAHFEAIAILAALLPDGRFDDLAAIQGELARTVDRTSAPKPAVIDGFPVGAPLDAEPVARLKGNQRFFWDVALLSTRLGDPERARRILASTSPTRTASSPLNGVLVLARVERMKDARALLEDFRVSSAQDVSASGYQQLAARLDRADKIGAARDAATGEERRAFEAVRLADLGAYWSALRVLADVAETPAATELTLQLLVACRFDGAAQAFAQRLGADGPAMLAGMMTSLPPTVRAQPPVPLTLEQVLIAAARPL